VHCILHGVIKFLLITYCTLKVESDRSMNFGNKFMSVLTVQHKWISKITSITLKWALVMHILMSVRTSKITSIILK
jgi:hypothetical protein